MFIDTFTVWVDASPTQSEKATELCKSLLKEIIPRNSLVVQQLELSISTAWGLGSIPVQGTKIPQVAWHDKNKRHDSSVWTSKVSLSDCYPSFIPKITQGLTTALGINYKLHLLAPPSYGRWWRTGKPGVLQSLGSQRVKHDWAAEQQSSGKVEKMNHTLKKTLEKKKTKNCQETHIALLRVHVPSGVIWNDPREGFSYYWHSTRWGSEQTLKYESRTSSEGNPGLWQQGTATSTRNTVEGVVPSQGNPGDQVLLKIWKEGFPEDQLLPK